MADYIDRKHALDLIESAATWGWSKNKMYDEMQDIPSADVAPVVHGNWIYRGEEKGYQCSVCQSFCLLNYESDWCASECCPHCGAKMDGDSKEVKK